MLLMLGVAVGGGLVGFTVGFLTAAAISAFNREDESRA